MLIPLMLALAAQAVDLKPLSMSAPAKSWFQSPAKPFAYSFGSTPPKAREMTGIAEPATLVCTITVLKPDPKFDARIVRPAPVDIDPKIVRPSPCRN
jgi:hypothetical protein